MPRELSEPIKMSDPAQLNEILSDPKKVLQFEQQCQAYFHLEYLRPGIFGGEILVDNDDFYHPLRILYRPTDSRHFLPEIQALGKIGFSAIYWSRLAEMARSNELDFADWKSMAMIAAYKTPNDFCFDTWRLDTDWTKTATEFILQEHNHAIKKYPVAVAYLNLGGDADFFGLVWSEHAIFPLYVNTGASELMPVPAESVGLSLESARLTKKPWVELFTISHEVFGTVLTNLTEEKVLPTKVVNFVASSKKQFSGINHLSREFYSQNPNDSLEIIYDQSWPLIAERINQIIKQDSNHPFKQAAENLAESLNQMYKTVQDFLLK
jgi:hypothetical protein